MYGQCVGICTGGELEYVHVLGVRTGSVCGSMHRIWEYIHAVCGSTYRQCVWEYTQDVGVHKGGISSPMRL